MQCQNLYLRVTVGACTHNMPLQYYTDALYISRPRQECVYIFVPDCHQKRPYNEVNICKKKSCETKD